MYYYIPMYDVESFKRMYPEWFSTTETVDVILGTLILSLIFFIPYLYIRFLENNLITLMENRLIPFIEFRMRLKKLIDIIRHVLEIPIFGNSRTKD